MFMILRYQLHNIGINNNFIYTDKYNSIDIAILSITKY